ncbi:MAG: ribonuclease P protein component [Gammaproteobacteria bacterium]|nr:ribonuclease P protein component [Gammaproteobacteria bacterium]
MDNARAESLGKQHRLDKPSQYKAVFSNAKRAHAGVFFIRSRDNQCGMPRLGLAFSVRAAGKAVARNRLKRLVRESFRRHKNHLPGRDYVVGCKTDKNSKSGKSGRNGAGRADGAQARAAMNRFWEKESARKEPPRKESP